MVATRQAASHILTLRMNPDKRIACPITGDPSKITKKCHSIVDPGLKMKECRSLTTFTKEYRRTMTAAAAAAPVVRSDFSCGMGMQAIVTEPGVNNLSSCPNCKFA